MSKGRLVHTVVAIVAMMPVVFLGCGLPVPIWHCEGPPAVSDPEHDYYFFTNCSGDDCSHEGCRVEGYLARNLDDVEGYFDPSGGSVGWERNVYSSPSAWLNVEGAAAWSDQPPEYENSHHNQSDAWTARFVFGNATFSQGAEFEYADPGIEVVSPQGETTLPHTIVLIEWTQFEGQ